MLQKPHMILIDLDGTLVDSVPDLTFCVDHTLAQLGLPKRGEDRVRNWVGNGVERLVQRALTNTIEGEPEEALFRKAYPIFLDCYTLHTSTHSVLYPGVQKGLDDLKRLNYPLGCVTNKAARFAEPLLEALGIHHYFGLTVSGDTLPRKKPDPLPLLHAAKFFNVEATQALMVGDSVSDVSAARNAGFQVACMTYGYNHGQDIRNAKPDITLDSLAELPVLLESSA